MSFNLVKLTPLLCTLGFSSAVQAQWIPNWLIGGSVGYADREADFRTNVEYFGVFQQQLALDPTIPASFIVRDHSDTGFIGGLFGGYQAICHKWLLGVELNFEWHDLDEPHGFAFIDAGNLVGFSGIENYESHTLTALTGRIGYAITPYFMPYFRFGVEIGRDTFSTEFETLNTTVLVSSGTISQRHWVHRFLTGLGIEMPLPYTCGATLRFEYNFHSKGRTIEMNKTLANLDVDGLTISTVSLTNAIQPFTQTWKTSLVWNIF